MIHVDGLSKTYYVHRKAPGLKASIRSLLRRERIAKEALRNVHFSVTEGEIVGLVGANGAGKTTLVKMLAGIIVPTAGTARVLGYEPRRRHNAMRRQIALIMGQKAQLWWDLPAADCFLLLREIYRIPPAQYEEDLSFLADRLQVRDQLHIQIRRLSLGERMKMELIAALLHRPRVVFLDEPTIGLDLHAQRAIREFLLEYRRRFRPAMLITSHYMEDIERVCERLLILRQGELVYDGPLSDIRQAFGNERVITVHLNPAGPRRPWSCPEDATLLDEEEDLLRVAAPRGRIPAVAADLLARLPVVDLTITDVDIGTVIERIQRGIEVARP